MTKPLLRLRNIFTFCIIAAISSGCALPTIKADASRLNNTKVYLVPTGTVQVRGVGAYGGGGGIAGLVVTLAITAINADKNKNNGDTAGEVFPAEEIFQIASDEIELFLQNNKSPREIVRFTRTLENDSFPTWFNNDSRTDLSSLGVSNSALVLDFGFQHLAITHYLFFGTYAEGSIGVRLIDPKNGQILGRATASGAGYQGGEKIQSDSSDSDFIAHRAEVRAAFSRLVRRLLKDAIDKSIA